ncbi:TetR/AcrR family transcriptional regulator [Streptomonospora sp. S1-112]|uniref:TetR/AcrR family transcriptional regulator n=1 Tax=Streptomonospora mangrovi TaxID=2883123 RepID=A0A9X3NFZ1_9ACTN|nr:TetR family transcriptional regulator [Streptomonospora mangrovi]MDA0562954.1 TetR/AcrR family transcriptional regulator [Streptomonospora mangrovi]
MTHAKGRPTPPPEGSATRTRLLDAAYVEVVAGRWARMRMADIAAAAGVSRQTLYNEFGSKEGLLQAVVVREAGQFLDTVERILTGSGEHPAHAVAESARWALTASAENPLLGAVITGDSELLPVLTTRAEPLHVELGSRMTDCLLERLPQIGRADAEAVAEVALRLILSYVLLPTDPDQAARRVELAVHSMIGAVCGHVRG